MGGKHSRNRKNRPLVIVLSLAMIFSAMTAFWSFGDGGEDSVSIHYDTNTGVHYIGNKSNENIVYCMNNSLHWPHTTDTYRQIPSYQLNNKYVDLSNKPEFRKALAYVLYAGYPKNGLGICKIEEINEEQFNRYLQIPEEIKKSAKYSQYFSNGTYSGTLTDDNDPTNKNPETKDVTYTGSDNYSYEDYQILVNTTSADADKERVIAKFDNLYNFFQAAQTDTSIKGSVFYKAVFAMLSGYKPTSYSSSKDISQGYWREGYPTPLDAINATAKYNENYYYQYSTQEAIWALMEKYRVNNNTLAGESLTGLAQTLYSNAINSTKNSILEGPETNINDIKIVRNDEKSEKPEFKYSNGQWTSDELVIKGDTSYQGTYTLSLPDGMTSTVGTQVKAGVPFKITSNIQPAQEVTVSADGRLLYLDQINVYSPISSADVFQNMIGATFGTKNVSDSINVKNNTGGLKLTKSFSFANGMTEDQKTAEKNKVTFTIQGEDDNTKNMTPITVKYSDLDSSGSKTIYGLTPGKYKVTESELGNDAYDVKTTYENSDTVTVSPGETTSEIITNTYSKKPTGSLTLKKSFDFGQDTDHPNPDTSKITFTLQRQDDISGFSKTVSYKDFQNGSYTVKDLPVGTYKITESGADVSGYADSLTVSVNGKTTGTIEVAKDGTTAAELKNTYTPTGSLTIHKSFVNSPLTETQKNGITFTITRKNTNETRTVSFDKFSTDGKYTFTDLPVDTYTIKESNAGGTVLTAYKDSAGNILKDQQAAISKGADTAVDVTNTYPSTPETPITVTPTTADLRVQKLIIGNDGNWPEGASFTMNLQAKDNAPMPDGTVNGVKSITVSSESPASFGTIQYEKAGTYHYIVTESKGSDKNFTYDETQHPVTVTVTESADHKLTASISGGNSSGIVEISNHYTKPKEENGGKEENSGGNKTNGSTNNSSGKNSSGGNKTNGSTSSKTNSQVQPANTKTLKNSLAKTNPSGSADSSGNASGSLVRTGDQTDLAVMIALLLTSACGLAGVLALKKKSRDDRTSEDRQ